MASPHSHLVIGHSQLPVFFFQPWSVRCMLRRGLWPLSLLCSTPHCCCFSSQGWVGAGPETRVQEGGRTSQACSHARAWQCQDHSKAGTGAQMLGWLTPFPGLSFTGFLSPDGMHKFLVEVGNGKAQAAGLGSNEVPSPSGPDRSCLSSDVIYYSFSVLATPLCETCRMA